MELMDLEQLGRDNSQLRLSIDRNIKQKTQLACPWHDG